MKHRASLISLFLLGIFIFWFCQKTFVDKKTGEGAEVIKVAFWLQASYELDHFGPICEELNKRNIESYFILKRPNSFANFREKSRIRKKDFDALLEQLKKTKIPL